MDSVKKIAVLGSGVMGIDIALLFAIREFSVLLWHRKDRDIASKRLSARISKYRKKDILTEEQTDSALNHIDTTHDLNDIAGCDLIIESIVEDFSEKADLLKRADSIAPCSILTSNTSSLSIDDLAESVSDPSNFAGLHFFNPVLRLGLVELVSGRNTSDMVKSSLSRLCEAIGKTPVLVKNSPGFIVNRLMASQVCQAIRMLEEGVASAHDIDSAVKLGLLHPIGPLALADLIGLDVFLDLVTNIYERTGDDSFRPPNSLRSLVASGRLGRKTGSGFHEQYD